MQGEARAAQQEVTGSKKESEALRGELDRTKGMVGTLRSEITDLLSQANATEEKLTQEVSQSVRAACLEGRPCASLHEQQTSLKPSFGAPHAAPPGAECVGFLSPALLTF